MTIIFISTGAMDSLDRSYSRNAFGSWAMDDWGPGHSRKRGVWIRSRTGASTSSAGSPGPRTIFRSSAVPSRPARGGSVSTPPCLRPRGQRLSLSLSFALCGSLPPSLSLCSSLSPSLSLALSGSLSPSHSLCGCLSPSLSPSAALSLTLSLSHMRDPTPP